MLGVALCRDVTQSAALTRGPAIGTHVIREARATTTPLFIASTQRAVRYCTVTYTVRDCDAEPPVPLAEMLTVPVNEYATAQVK